MSNINEAIKLNKIQNYNSLFLENKYQEFIETYINFPNPNLETHTMSYALNNFCNQKLPINIIKNYLERGYTIDILGVYPDLFITYSHEIGYSNVYEIPFINNKKVKKHNFLRPKFFIGNNSDMNKKIIIAITPGEDYIKHYTSILMHSLSLLGENPLKIINIFRFKLHEENICIWSNLSEELVKKNDLIILGYVDELIDNIYNLGADWKHISFKENEFYSSNRFITNNGRKINFIGVKFSYWGNLSKYLVKRLLELGAIEIIYSAKLGSLTNPKSLYETIFSPSKYITYDYIEKTSNIFSLENNFIKKFHELDTGLHCSVPTILEQNYYLREKLSSISVNSIDNEISQIANVILEFNNNNNKNISFSCIHFATDYLRNFSEKFLNTTYDLSNNRNSSAKLKKAEIIRSISVYLWNYLKSI